MKSAGAQTTRGENTYQTILDAIRDGVYAPGDRLREEEVAQRLGVSRTPVREALGRLHEKGLLEAAPGRGLAVTILNMEQIFELYAMRAELESLVARFAAQHATDVEVANLARINQKLGEAETPQDAAQLNRQFHARLYDATRNRYLRMAVGDLHETIALLPTTTFVKDGRIATAFEEHGAIIEALSAKDADAAAKAGRDHIVRALETRLAITRDERP